MAGEELCQSQQVIPRLLHFRHFEDARRAIAPGGDDFALVRTEARAHDLVVLLQRECERFTRGRIPQTRVKIPAGNEQTPPICAEVYLVHQSIVMHRWSDWGACRSVPDA